MTERTALLCAWGLLCVLVLALAARNLDAPGLYYDEVIQALPAAEFLRDDGQPLQIPGARNTWLFGGWFPLMTQPYMGALKSQALIPTFAAFGTSRETLRLATLAWGLLGLLLVMLWAREVFGLPTAIVAGALLAVDPSFLFVTRHDWGSFSLALVCRGGGLLLVTKGWRRPSGVRLFAGGLLLGLGVYNKIDFAAFLAAAAAALLVVAPRTVAEAFRSHRGRLVALAAGLLLGAAPMIASMGGVLEATRTLFESRDTAGVGWGTKLQTHITMLDGSYFHRLMLAGGDFESLGAVEGAAAGPFLAVFLAAAAVLALRTTRGARRGEPLRAEAWVLATALLTTVALLLTPRAVRIHHTLNVHPFPHLVVAAAAVGLYTARPVRAARRALAVAAVAAALAGSLVVDLRTLATLAESGGRGRWSGALEALASELEGQGAVPVALDWGFAAQLRFTHPALAAEEPVWKMHQARRQGRAFVLEGGPQHVYLIQKPRWAVFDVGAALLDAVEGLPFGTAVVREHPDRRGEAAFVSVRFARPHQLVYRGAFEVRLR